MKFGSILAATAVAAVLAACGQSTDTPSQSDIIATNGSEIEPENTGKAGPASDYVQPDYAKLSGYGEGWYISPGWSGEYPAG